MQHRTRKIKIVTLLLVLAVLFVSACSKSNNESKPTASGGTSTPASTGAASKEPANKGPFSKFDPPIELKTGRNTEGMKFEEGRSIDDNQYYDAYRDQLGIKVKNEWVVSNGEGYQNKLNVSIASGSIPDLLVVNGAQLRSMIEADMVADLTDVYNKRASENTKKMMMADGGVAMKAATYGGKLYGLPITASAIDSVGVLWIRDDWLKKLNLNPPQTIQDVVTIAQAFKDSDPTGKTVGFGMSKELQSMGSPNIGKLLNAFHAYPDSWVKGSDGKLVYGSTLPEMKKGLALLAEMNKKGLMDKEFGVKDVTKVIETISAGKLGLFFGDMAAPLYAINGSKKNDPNAEWSAYPIPSADGQPALVEMGGLADQYHVIRKGYKHPEAVVELMNFWIEKNWINPDAPLSRNEKTGIMYYPYGLVTSSPPTKNLDAHLEIADALATGNESKMSTESKYYLDKIKKWKNDKSDVGDWGLDRVFGVNKSSMEVIQKMKQNNQLHMSGFLGGSTPAMAEKFASLRKMEQVMVMKIILGSAGLEEFDKFVSDWYKQGGDQITKEVNDWYEKSK
ncbi:extracellular solute-binding protein [Paenibacillus sp. MBLB4367]|uniref:extracellular solute-binding protein n=1 Tax=Paenibacillus sp. MBLB4367 TaxID=3384767 RepID=UPI0039084598